MPLTSLGDKCVLKSKHVLKCNYGIGGVSIIRELDCPEKLKEISYMCCEVPKAVLGAIKQ